MNASLFDVRARTRCATAFTPLSIRGSRPALHGTSSKPPTASPYLATEESQPSLRRLKSCGYATAFFGMWNLGRGRSGPVTPGGQGFQHVVFPENLGFGKDEYFDDRGNYLSDRLTDEVLNFVEKNRDRPFFCPSSRPRRTRSFQPPARSAEKVRTQRRPDEQRPPRTIRPMRPRLKRSIKMSVGSSPKTQAAKLDRPALTSTTTPRPNGPAEGAVIGLDSRIALECSGIRISDCAPIKLRSHRPKKALATCGAARLQVVGSWAGRLGSGRCAAACF